MKLHDLTLANLSTLHDFLGTLRDIGARAEKAGLSVHFDLTPGCPAAIWTDFVMPDAEVGEEPEAVPLPEWMLPVATPEPVKAPEPPYSMPPASGPGWRTGEAWTEDEDEAIIAAAVANPDWSGGAIARAIAGPMRRTVSAMSFRINHTLRDRIKAARAQTSETAAPMQTPPQGEAAAERPAKAAVAAAADAGQPLPAASSPDAVKPAPAVDTHAAGDVAIDPSLPTWQRQLRAHLNAVGYADPWSKEKDLLLVEGLLKGMGISGAAEWAGVEAAVGLKRWNALTDPLPKDAKGRPMMEWQQRLLVELRARCDAQVAA